jgi:plasmid replication initiation protein
MKTNYRGENNMNNVTGVKEADTRDCIRVVTSNDFLKIKGLSDLSLNALKLMYLAIAQCRKDDDVFYTCLIKEKDLAKLWGISKQAVNKISGEITEELGRFIIIKNDLNKYNYIRKFNVPMFGIILDDYDEKGHKLIRIALNPFAEELFLHLNDNFSQPLLCDFNKMKSVNSILIWHLIQVKIRSDKPVGNKIYKITLSLNELRILTNTIDSYDTKDFKKRVINQAIKDIKKCCNVDIECKSVKKERRTIGYELTLKDKFYISKNELSARAKKEIQKAENLHNKKIVKVLN